MRIISIANQKGGCGKTTTTINLSACLALKGKTVLLIDMDPQGHSSIGLNINPSGLDKTIFNVLGSGSEAEKTTLDDVILQVAANFNIAPSSLGLSALEQNLTMAQGRETRLKEAIGELYERYDYIIIDCPPSLGLLTFNSLMASTEIFISIDMGFFSLHGTGKLMEIIDMVHDKTGHELRVKAIGAMYDKRTRIAVEILQNIKDHFNDSMFSTVINTNTKLKEAASYGKSIVEYDKNSQGYRDYLALAEEVIAEEMIPGVVRPAQQKTPAPQLTSIKKQFFCHAPQAKSVTVVGTFSDWVPFAYHTMERDDKGGWSKTIALKPGTHQYKFIVDGEWIMDKNNPKTVKNEFGSENSLIEIH